MSVSYEQSAMLAPRTAEDLMQAVRGAHMPFELLEPGSYQQFSTQPGSGFEKTVSPEGVHHELHALIMNEQGTVYPVSRVTIPGQEGSAPLWSGLTVAQMEADVQADGSAATVPLGFVDRRDGLAAQRVDDDVIVRHCEMPDGGEGIQVINSNRSRAVIVAYSDREGANTGGGYFGEAWAVSRLQSSFWQMYVAGGLPGMDNAPMIMLHPVAGERVVDTGAPYIAATPVSNHLTVEQFGGTGAALSDVAGTIAVEASTDSSSADVTAEEAHDPTDIPTPRSLADVERELLEWSMNGIADVREWRQELEREFREMGGLPVDEPGPRHARVGRETSPESREEGGHFAASQDASMSVRYPMPEMADIAPQSRGRHRRV